MTANKLEGFVKGDRVEVKIQGVVVDDEFLPLKILLDGWAVPSTLHDRAVAAPTFSITRIEPPIAVGDRVVDESGREYEVVAPPKKAPTTLLKEAALWSDETGYVIRYLGSLTRIP